MKRSRYLTTLMLWSLVSLSTMHDVNAVKIDKMFKQVKHHKEQIYDQISDAIETIKSHITENLIHNVKELSSLEIFKIYSFSQNTALFAKLSPVFSGTVDQIVHDIIKPLKDHDTGLAQDCLNHYQSIKQDLIPNSNNNNNNSPSYGNIKKVKTNVKQLLELCNFDEVFDYVYEKAKPFIMLNIFTLLEKILEAYKDSSETLLALVGELADNKLKDPVALKAEFVSILENQFTQHLSSKELNKLITFFKSSAWKKLKNNADKLKFSELLDKLIAEFPSDLKKTIKQAI